MEDDNNALLSCDDNDMLSLNVGGTTFTTLTQTLLKIPDTYFSALVSGRWNKSINNASASRAIFIDRDPSMFAHILNYMRAFPKRYMGAMSLSQAKQRQLEDECDFFGVPQLMDDIRLFDNENMWSKLMMHKRLHNKQRRLLFKTSVHGTSLETFHEMCDNHSGIVVLATLPDNTIIGAYSSLCISSSANRAYWKEDCTVFLFIYKQGNFELRKLLVDANKKTIFTGTKTTSIAIGTDFDIGTSLVTLYSSPSNFASLPVFKETALKDLEVWSLDT